MMREMVYLPKQIQLNCLIGVTYPYSWASKFTGYDDIRATTLREEDISYWRANVSGTETTTFIRIG